MSFEYIVTGAAGFIGRNIAASLNARGCSDILLVDELGETEKWKNLRGLQYEDLWDPGMFRQAVLEDINPGGIKALFHLGACSATTETDADYLLDNNYRYTRDLCEWCLSQGIRFVYASSAATYGNSDLGYSDADEKTPGFSPLNMYGYSKHMFDLWALKNDVLDQIAGLKYFNVYGPYEDHKDDMRSVVNKAHEQILSTGEVELFRSHRPDYEDGQQLRDFVYVKDAVDVTLWLGDHPEVGGVFNCGTGEARSWVDLVSAVFRAMGREPNIRFVDMPEHLRSKYQYYTQADMGKLRAAGYGQAFSTLEEGVTDYVQSYLQPLRGD